MYQQLIRELDPTVNPRWVEGFIRVQYGTLSHLDLSDFKREIRLFKEAQREELNDDLWESTAKSYGI